LSKVDIILSNIRICDLGVKQRVTRHGFGTLFENALFPQPVIVRKKLFLEYQADAWWQPKADVKKVIHRKVQIWVAKAMEERLTGLTKREEHGR